MFSTFFCDMAYMTSWTMEAIINFNMHSRSSVCDQGSMHQCVHCIVILPRDDLRDDLVCCSIETDHGRRACQHDHLLHDVMENSTHRKKLKSRRPLIHHVQQLVSSVHPQETVTHLTQARWAGLWASTTRLHKSMPTLSNSGQGVGLSRRAWTRLNRLRTGVGRFGANMLCWGLSMSDTCNCGAEQTADHITSGRCPIYRPPEGMDGLIELDIETRSWLENYALDM